MKLIDYLLEEVPVLQITKTSPISLKIKFFTEVLGFSLELIKKEIKQFKIVRYYFTGKKETLYEEDEFDYLVLQKYEEQLKLNMEMIKKEIFSGHISKETYKKIENVLEIVGIKTKEELFEELKTSKLASAIFYMLTKNPKKQNIPEKTALSILQKANPNIKNLPQTGKNALHLTPEGQFSSTANGNSKAIDFYLEKDDKKYYIFHKFTEQSGGAQDNQLRDAINFLINAKNNKEINSYFVALLDGNYYKDKLVYLKKTYSTSRVFVMTTGDFKLHI